MGLFRANARGEIGVFMPDQGLPKNPLDKNIEEKTVGLLQRVVQTMLPATDSIGVLLSGGFDSSLIAGLLAAYRNDHNLLLINSRANDSWVSDERYCARVVADMINVPLIEQKYNLDRSVVLDIGEIPCAPRPVDTVLALEFYRALSTIANDIGVGTFFTGHGGDQLFLSLLTHHFILDYIRDIGFDRNVIFYFINYLSNTKKGVSGIFLDVLKDLVFQPKTIIDRRAQHHNRYLINTNVWKRWDNESGILEHVIPKQVGFSKAWQLLGLLDYDSFSSPFEVENYRFVHPFCSQPLWEHFLSLPSYILLDGGISRGFIRRVSSTIVPPVITHRFSKGGGGPLMQNHAKHRINQDFLRSGILVARNYVDLKALEKAFAQVDQPKAYNRICDLLSIEIWLQNLMCFVNG
uniref:Asparagine synthase n=2 Tax=Acidithiobacillus sulfuriphilus TaxID=1867749 RepID=A0A3M8RTJ5_9PROT|nr:asparagine synthase [Acidithiobacillus sulfuriphilus]